MSPKDLIHFLDDNGVVITVNGDELAVRASKGVLDTRIVALMKSHKAELLDVYRLRVPDTLPPFRLTPDLLPLVRLTQPNIDLIVDSTAGGVDNIQDIYPLSPLQEGILFHHLLEGDGDAYLLRTVAAFDSRSRLDNFLAALQQVIDRHDILRTAIRYSGLPQPVQVVYRHARLKVETLAVDGGTDVLQQLLRHTDPRRVRMDLQAAPLLTAWIVQDLASGEWLMSLLNHHIVGDNYTLQLILAEIQMVLRGEAAKLPPPQPYRNFIGQRQRVAAAEHEAFFRRELGVIDEPTAPFGIIDVRGDGDDVTEVATPLPSELAGRVRETARKLGVPVAVLFHVAWAHVLGRCSGQSAVVFGTVLSGRLQGSTGADRTMGLFVNTLPIRVVIGEYTVREAVTQTYRTLSELLVHEQASLALAQRCSGVLPPMPLFTSLFNYRHSTLISEASVSPWEGLRLLRSEERTNFPLTMSVDDLGQGFTLTAQCVPGIGAERVVGYLQTAMEQLVGALEAPHERPLRAIDILPPDESEQVLQGFNRTEHNVPADALVHELFEAQAQRCPQATAVEYENERLSYDELDRRANQVAHWLRGQGVKPDDRVALCMQRGLAMVVGLMGILKAGAAYVPLDPTYPEQRLQYMLQDSAPIALLTQSDLLPRLRSVRPCALLLLDADAALLAVQADSNPEARRDGLCPSHLAYIIYTSGSTGLPKGVAVTHRPVINLIDWVNRSFNVGPDDKLLFTTSVCFDLSVYDVFGILAAGAVVRIASRRELQEPAELVRLLYEKEITFWDSAPAVFKQLIPFLKREQGSTSQPGLRLAFFSGDWIPLDLPSSLRQAFPMCEVIGLGGATEATIWSNYFPIGSLDPAWTSVPYGRPIQNARYYVLDDALQPCPIGVPGDLYIGGDCLSACYFNRPELTAKSFLPDPFASRQRARMYRTGDRARFWEDGIMEFLGRRDTQVKVRGFRVELGEIEAQLTQCDGVREAVVTAPNDTLGERRLVAYVVPIPGATVSPADLRNQLAHCLADYMLPTAFVTMESFPVTSNGKLDRNALPAPDLVAVGPRRYLAPQGPVEEAIAQVWCDLLGLEKVGQHDNFFELGGHSLLAAQLVIRLRDRFGFELPLRTLFNNAVLSDLAAHIVAERLSHFPKADLDGVNVEVNALSEEELLNMLNGIEND